MLYDLNELVATNFYSKIVNKPGYSILKTHNVLKILVFCNDTILKTHNVVLYYLY